MTLDTRLWLVLTLFMVHEFEEIVFIRPWLARHRDDPRIRAHPFYSSRDVSTSTIALMIAEEFVLFALFTVFATVLGWYSFYWGFLLLYTAHLVGHGLEPLRFGMRTPSSRSALLTLPWCGYVLWFLMGGRYAQPGWSLLWTAVMSVVVGWNFRLLYGLAPRVEAWLRREFYQGEDPA